MHVCMYECMYICIYVYMYEWMHVCMNACIYVYMYECMHVCMYVWMHVCIYVWMHVWVGVRVFNITSHMRHISSHKAYIDTNKNIIISYIIIIIIIMIKNNNIIHHHLFHLHHNQYNTKHLTPLNFILVFSYWPGVELSVTRASSFEWAINTPCRDEYRRCWVKMTEIIWLLMWYRSWRW